MNAPKLFLIDGIGPFFRGSGPKRVNWSKIPFERLSRDGDVRRRRFAKIRRDFERFARRVSQLGFNAVTLDDVAHLTDCDAYPADLRTRISAFREEFAGLFEIAAGQGLKVFLTTDLMFFNPTLDRLLDRDHGRILDFLERAIEDLLIAFPALGGIILRIGESDGLDVAGDFRSELVVHSPKLARRYLERLLPLFERHRRLLVFRTWSVGAYPIGDLIWNRNTFDRTFGGLDSPNLVISMKPGESDFFRFLPLNKLFFRSDHAKIFEIQARREYEGCGEYPSFIGWDLEAHRESLRGARNVVGVSVWCQTGGWTKFRRLTYVRRSSVWNEINVEVALALFRDRASTEDAIAAFHRRRALPGAAADLVELLRLSDEVIKELLYIDDFARQKVFFRRLRIPPLLAVYWDRILINHPMRKFLRCFVEDAEATIRQGYGALDKIRCMRELADGLGLPVEDLDYQLQTFEILAVAREYYFGPYDEQLAERLFALRRSYKDRSRKPRYTVHLDFSTAPFKRTHLRLLLAVLARRQRGYRILDRVITVRLLAVVYPLVRRWDSKLVPKFARKQAMGIDTIFR
ncbi:MAG: hypothetical protein AAGD06_28220 [Acidobacteriota bacterium]